MDVIYSLIPAMILLAVAAIAVFFWSARSGQYDDMEGPRYRILTDDDDPLLPEVHRKYTAQKAQKSENMIKKGSDDE